jgi:hypothetical protein
VYKRWEIANGSTRRDLKIFACPCWRRTLRREKRLLPQSLGERVVYVAITTEEGRSTN